jgi:hypothetical protein
MVGVNAATIIYSLGTNDTWTTAGSPYQVKNSIILTPNSTLTIHGGVTVEFACDSSLIIDDANIITNGTSQTPIIFTSSKEIIYCRWAGIQLLNLSPTSAPGGEVTLRGISFVDAGTDGGQRAIISAEERQRYIGVTVTLKNVTISGSVKRKQLLYSTTTYLNIIGCKFTPGTISTTN